MSKLVYVCGRNSQTLVGIEEKLHIIADRITPDNLQNFPQRIVHNHGIAYAITNHVSSVIENNNSVLLGVTFPEEAEWSKPLSGYPDGSYAIFRSDEDHVEIITDVMASRTVWYYHNEEIFISATSQRAIVMLLGSLEFNEQVIPWLLSSGHPGPANSWDSRIKMLPPDSSAILERKSWSLEIKSNPVEYTPEIGSDKEHAGLFETAVSETFKALKLDYSKWLLPLSGGYDSRLILCMLVAYKKSGDLLKSITWGLKSSLKIKGNDASIAKQLADHYNISNTYHNTDFSTEPIEKVINRFIVNGEGRIDHVGAYLDGFALWKELAHNKVEGLIRGDVGFTSKPATNPFYIRFTQGFPQCSDFENLKDYESYGIQKQEVSPRLSQLDSETTEQWRDRLYEEFRVPTVLSALTDLKLSYVEIINPLLSRKIIYQSRKLPVHLRNEKRILKELVDKLCPGISMASDGATADLKNFLRSPAMIELFRNEFSAPSQTVISKEFCDYILGNLKTTTSIQTERSSFKSLLKRYLPSSLKSKLLSMRSHSTVDFNLIAFRIYTIVKMHRLLKEDVNAFPSEKETDIKKNLAV